MTKEELLLIGSEGNPGALAFIMEAFASIRAQPKMMIKTLVVAVISGESLYIFSNDCCERDMNKAVLAGMHFSIEDLHTFIEGDGGRGAQIFKDKVV